MTVALLFAVIVAVVSVGAFISGRRFGALSFGLAAGSVLSSLWSGWLAGVMQTYGLSLPWLPVGVLSIVLLLILPMLVLLVSGPKYSKKFKRLVFSLAIGVLTAAFLVQPLVEYMVLEGDAVEVYQWLSSYWQYVVTVGLVVGLMDLFAIHSRKASLPDKKH